jgi:hypothetical protein
VANIRTSPRGPLGVAAAGMGFIVEDTWVILFLFQLFQEIEPDLKSWKTIFMFSLY